MTKQWMLVLTICALVIDSFAQYPEKLSVLLDTRSAKLVQSAKVLAMGDARKTYLHFVESVTKELRAVGDNATAARITDAMMDPSAKFPRTEFAWITHSFARDFYKDEIIRETAALVRFKTFATDVPNRQNPEFIKQKEYLHSLATKLGLMFKDVDGYVQEIWIGEGKESFGIMSHSDVQPVEPSEWTNDPWSGDVIDGKIWGRGSVDDKGPIVAVMYGMRAILDSGLPLKKKIILLVGTDEESANEDVTTYLKDNKAPDQTIVVDSNFPVICAEKGWGGIWLKLLCRRTLPTGQGLWLADVHAGFSPSIVPGKAIAKLVNVGGSAEGASQMIQAKAKEFTAKRKGAQMTVETMGDTIVVTAQGKSVHSSVPATGHNALMDLLVFLDRDLKPMENDISLMTKFAAKYVGFELNGKSLGIAYTDSFMGPLTVAADMFQVSDTVMFMFNFRTPKGIATADIEKQLQKRFDEFGKKYGVKFSDRRYVGQPLYNDPNTPFIQKLLVIYNSITKETRKAQSIGGGTYAHRIPNAVVFGPAMPDEEYLGHQPNEYFKVSTLIRNIEILTNTMVEFGM